MRSISPASPKPLRIRFAPSAASALAMARPMPEVEPVTRAVLPLRNISRDPVAGMPPLFRSGRVDLQPARRLCIQGERRAGMRLDDYRMSDNVEEGRSGGGFGFGGGGMGGGIVGLLFGLVLSRFGIVGVLILLL